VEFSLKEKSLVSKQPFAEGFSPMVAVGIENELKHKSFQREKHELSQSTRKIFVFNFRVLCESSCFLC
jgi:hypothetical protein